jgi:drug/metabolite transporter (DMT)-like permease
MNSASAENKVSTAKLLLAFASIYLIWGSTYLAIRYAIETLPPLLMAGVRFLVAGGVLYGWASMRSAARPTLAEWRRAAVIGGLLLLGGNGLVTLAERTVPSGLTALLIATEPLMIVMLDWLRPGGVRPLGKVAVGLVLGLAGMVILIGPAGIAGANAIDPLGAAFVVLASLSWAMGSLYTARSHARTEPVLGSGMQMLAGGALLFAVGLIRGEASTFSSADVSLRSLGALAYLIIFGGIVAFSSYSWLLRVTRPSLASTYAYVNPVIAVFLGWAVAGEPITLRTIIAAAIIIASVVLISAGKESTPRASRAVGASREKTDADSRARRARAVQCVSAGD